jgi:CYTH domain-containing protein
MAVEIERKFLINLDAWNIAEKGVGHFYRQGYILSTPEKTIRVRVTEENGFLTIKGKTINLSRPEYEYEINKQDANELLDQFCSSEISKIRYKISFAGKIWEVDEFLGANEGLIVAEIELSKEGETFDQPAWIGKEVTGIERYYNSELSKLPYKEW